VSHSPKDPPVENYTFGCGIPVECGVRVSTRCGMLTTTTPVSAITWSFLPPEAPSNSLGVWIHLRGVRSPFLPLLGTSGGVLGKDQQTPKTHSWLLMVR